MKILIFNGILTAQILLFLSSVSVSHRNLYWDLTEKCPFFSPSHLGRSFSLDKAHSQSPQTGLLSLTTEVDVS